MAEEHAWEYYIMAASIFVFAVCCSFLPWCLKGARRWLSLGNVFAGGVLLAAAFIHLLPDAVSQYKGDLTYQVHLPHQFSTGTGNCTVSDDYALPLGSRTSFHLTGSSGQVVTCSFKPDDGFPWPFLFMSIGFLSIWILEETCMAFVESRKDSTAKRRLNARLEHREYASMHTGAHKRPGSPSIQRLVQTDVRSAPASTGPSPTLRPIVPLRQRSEGSSPLLQPLTGNGPFDQALLQPIATGHGKTLPPINDPNHSPKHDHGHTHVAIQDVILSQPIYISLIFMVALSLHSLLAGFAMGLESGEALWSIFAAIIAHKGLAAFALATSFVKSDVNLRLFVLVMVVFSCTTPLGVIVGYQFQLDTEGTTQSVILAVGAGTFIYISLLEILSKEMENKQDKMLKLLVMVLGFAGMTSLAIWL